MESKKEVLQNQLLKIKIFQKPLKMTSLTPMYFRTSSLASLKTMLPTTSAFLAFSANKKTLK
jgi:hypothetical protein